MFTFVEKLITISIVGIIAIALMITRIVRISATEIVLLLLGMTPTIIEILVEKIPVLRTLYFQLSTRIKGTVIEWRFTASYKTKYVPSDILSKIEDIVQNIREYKQRKIDLSSPLRVLAYADHVRIETKLGNIPDPVEGILWNLSVEVSGECTLKQFVNKHKKELIDRIIKEIEKETRDFITSKKFSFTIENLPEHAEIFRKMLGETDMKISKYRIELENNAQGARLNIDNKQGINCVSSDENKCIDTVKDYLLSKML